jgi:hypothetical protein
MNSNEYDKLERYLKKKIRGLRYKGKEKKRKRRGEEER